MKVVAAALCLLLSSIVSGAPADPYRWLEDGDAPAVARWTEAQNAATRKALDHLPGRAALEDRLGRLYAIGSLGAPVSRPSAAGQAGKTGRQARSVVISTPVVRARRTRQSSTCATAFTAPIAPSST